MKKIVFSLLLLLFAAAYTHAVRGQEYRVAVENTLNVRSSADAGAAIVGSLRNGQRVYVHATENGWARITYNGAAAWVKQDYLVPLPPAQNNYGGSRGGRKKTEGFFWGFAILAFVLFQIRMRADFNWFDDFFTIAFIVFCSLELAYYFGSLWVGSNPMWFIDPHEAGFFRALVHTFVYGFFSVIHLLTFFDFNEVQFEDDNTTLGFFSAVVFAVLFGLPEWLIDSIVDVEVFTIVLIAIFALCQIIQLILTTRESNFGRGLIYLTCITASALVYAMGQGWFFLLVDALEIF